MGDPYFDNAALSQARLSVAVQPQLVRPQLLSPAGLAGAVQTPVLRAGPACRLQALLEGLAGTVKPDSRITRRPEEAFR